MVEAKEGRKLSVQPAAAETAFSTEKKCSKVAPTAPFPEAPPLLPRTPPTGGTIDRRTVIATRGAPRAGPPPRQRQHKRNEEESVNATRVRRGVGGHPLLLPLAGAGGLAPVDSFDAGFSLRPAGEGGVGTETRAAVRRKRRAARKRCGGHNECAESVLLLYFI